MRGKIIFEEHIAMPDDDKDGFPACRNVDSLREALLDLHDARLKEMNANGVELAIISQNTPGPQGLTDPKESAAYAKRANDYLANVVDRAPCRFAALAAIPMHDPEDAVAEVTRCINELGMVGVNLNDGQQYVNQATGRISEYFYDDPRYDVFWATVEKLDVPVYLHPRAPLPDDIQRLYATRPWLLGPTYSFIRDTSFHVLAICTSGVFDRFPGVKLAVGHFGEGILAYLSRLDYWLEKRDRGRGLRSQKTVRQYLESNVFITSAGHFSTPVLLHAMSEIGIDRLLFSVDTPYANITEASEWIDTLPISHGDVEKFGRTNALKLFPRLATRLRSDEVAKEQRDRQRVLFTVNAGFEQD
ncbi:uncharacterized protein Z520_11389 [Fonsecaea multimorphosa CBS 102226]|uniref:Amidohydrolase-related domain-containing protein n=1 Tax=Fonsecaea multimorphosa CBS 102226 TaxID=1442371 RepID=A0A0D2K991_9EURO|nr:uncharacterized protein Z520_11389 [Fonsecaea multimorphosa CBS 102226]KIX92913.1 hypothetical protein Z520_11389 [Fonsecaea multimorphosa CBS 102226]OAL18163.1 hypothetical protein AYO22_10940 [Fonsecaea multimorphosa]